MSNYLVHRMTSEGNDGLYEVNLQNKQPTQRVNQYSQKHKAPVVHFHEQTSDRVAPEAQN